MRYSTKTAIPHTQLLNTFYTIQPFSKTNTPYYIKYKT